MEEVSYVLSHPRKMHRVARALVGSARLVSALPKPARTLLAAPPALLPALARSSALRGFAASDRAFASLASALAAELSHEKKEYVTPELVKQGPPEPWTLSDEEGAAELVRQLPRSVAFRA